MILIGKMSIYGSQAEASQQIPQQWRAFTLANPALVNNSNLYGASPCTSDRKIHYLTGVAQESSKVVVGDDRVTLEIGEYAVVLVDDAALLRDTWTWLLGCWLPGSGRQERRAPEFERYTSISDGGIPIGLVETAFPSNRLRVVEDCAFTSFCSASRVSPQNAVLVSCLICA